MSAPTTHEIRPDAIVLADVIQVDITWALVDPSGDQFTRQRRSS
jgi:hypothetical protein